MLSHFGAAAAWSWRTRPRGEPRPICWKSRLGEVAGVRARAPVVSGRIQALSPGAPDADADAMQARSHALLQRVINLQLAAQCPSGLLRSMLLARTP